MGHGEIREIRKLASALPERFEEVVEEVREVVTRWRSLEGQAAEAAEVVEGAREEEEEEEEEESQEAPPIPFPKNEVRRVLDIAIDARRSRDRNDAELAIRTAMEKLRLVTPERLQALVSGPNGERIRAAVDEIARWVTAVNAAGIE